MSVSTKAVGTGPGTGPGSMPDLASGARWREPWLRCTLAWIALCAVLLVSMRLSIASMVEIWWRDETFTHCLVVPLLSAWLVWRLRDELSWMAPQPARPAALLLAMFAGLLIWQLGVLTQVNAVQHFMVVALLIATVPLCFGWAIARRLAFPLLFLFFAVPFGTFLTPWLVNLTADVTIGAIRLTGVPVYREANQFVIPSGRWSVIDACSGVRYLMSSVMVGTLFAYLNYRSLKRRLIFVGLSIIVPIVANWGRAYMIVMLGHLSNNKIATGVDHLVYGWVFFGIVIFALFMIGARWSEPDAPPAVAPAALPVADAQAAAARATSALWRNLGLTLALLLSMGLALNHWLMVPRPEAGERALPIWPERLSPQWVRGTETPILRPEFPDALAESHASFDGPKATVWIDVARFAPEGPGRLVSSVNILAKDFDPQWNTVESRGRAETGLPSLPRVQRERLLERDATVGNERRRLQAWRFYWVGGADGAATSSDIQAKLMQARERLQGRSGQGRLVVLMALESPQAPAEDVLRSFLHDNEASLGQWLGAPATAPAQVTR